MFRPRETGFPGGKHPLRSFQVLFLEGDVILFSDVCQDLTKRLVELFERLIGVPGKPLIFDFLPKDFNQIEFRAVGRQEPKVEPLGLPLRNLRLKRVARVNGSIVDDDSGWLAELFTKAVDALDGGGRVDTAIDHIRIEMLAIVPQESQHIELTTPAGRDLQALANGLPRVGHAGSEGKAGLVAVVKVIIALKELLANLLQLTLVTQNFFRLVFREAICEHASSEDRASSRFVLVCCR